MGQRGNTKKSRKYVDLSENKNISYQNLWNAKFFLISRVESSHSVVQQLGGRGRDPVGTITVLASPVGQQEVLF